MSNVDRAEAGRQLAAKVTALPWKETPVVLAIAPSAVPLAFEVAQAFHNHAELDLLEVRPFFSRARPDMELGVVASGGIRVVHGQVQAALNLSDEAVAEAASQVVDEIHKSEKNWRRFHARTTLSGRSVLWVADVVGKDARLDGAALIAKALGAARVVCAAAYALKPTVEQVRTDADDVICLDEVDDPNALGGLFGGQAPSFDQVRELLERAEEWRAPVVV